MKTKQTSIIILAAGQGSRMRSTLPKVLHSVGNLPMINHVLNAAQQTTPESINIVLSPNSIEIEETVIKNHTAIKFFYQNSPLGTAHAVLATESFLQNYDGNIIVLYADTPLISVDTLNRLRNALDQYDLVVVGMTPKDTRKYGRIILGSDGSIDSIIETHNGRDEDQRKALQSPICNAGLMAFNAKKILPGLLQIPMINDEYPLTHIISYCHENKLSVGLVLADERECHGVNSRSELAIAEENFQSMAREKLMRDGVTLIDPSSTYVSFDTVIKADSIIEPHVYFGPNVSVESYTRIRSFSYLEGCTISSHVNIGPFARIRPETHVGESSRVGNFVELKNTTLANGSKVNHLSYIGDTDVGTKTNIGAGTITCNYDGYRKSKTTIGNNVFIGANTSLIAPLTIEDGSIIAAGSTITKNVNKDAIASGRAQQKEVAGAALKYHNSKRKED